MSKRGPSQASARDSEWSVRSDADSEYGQNHQEEGQDSKEELEDPSPYNDLSKHIFAQLKEREATRRERDRRAAARYTHVRTCMCVHERARVFLFCILYRLAHPCVSWVDAPSVRVRVPVVFSGKSSCESNFKQSKMNCNVSRRDIDVFQHKIAGSIQIL